jgi:hypothetical protein
MKLPAAILALTLATQAHAASEATCVTWAIHAKADATKIEQVDRAYYWCLNQDLDPPLVDMPATVNDGVLVVKNHASVSEAAGPSCKRYRSYDPKTHTVLSYGQHHRKACR